MDLTELQNIAGNYTSELELAQRGKNSSLSYIVNEVPKTPIAKNGEVFQIIVVGGSMTQSAIVKKEESGIEILSQKKLSVPDFSTKKIFLEFIYPLIDKKISHLCLNFAFALKPIFENNILDGVLIHPTKEHLFKGLIGERVGVEISSFVALQRQQKLLVSVANDTICLLLSGLSKYSWDNMASLVVGTGVNAAIFSSEYALVNLESGNFNKLFQSAEDKIIDKSSTNPGKYMLEKQVSGEYLFKLFNLRIKNANIAYPELKSTKQMGNALGDKNPKVSQTAREILARSAELVAAVVLGILDFSKKDLNFVVEGNLFWNATLYKETVQGCLQKLNKTHIATFTRIYESTLLGAAKLVC